MPFTHLDHLSAELSAQLETATTRRRVVTTGAKLAYATPLVAASFKLSGRGASAALSPVDFCGHSVGTNGGCKGACAAAGFTGKQCNPICGNGQFVGACPVGQGGDNPCCNPGYCDRANFTLIGGVVTYVGPTTGCPPVTTTTTKPKKK